MVEVEKLVVQLGSERLRQKSKEISSDEDLQKQIDIMAPILYETNGLGLAAPQVAEVPNNRLVLYNKELKRTREQGDFSLGVMINPEIIWKSDKEQEYEESCLSIVGISAKVKSPEKLTVRYQDLERKMHEESFDELGAVLMNHEIAHLDGNLYIDRIKDPNERKAKIEQYKDIHKSNKSLNIEKERT